MVDLTFYGGVNEIGGNKVLLKSKDGSLFFDFGQSYKSEGEFFEEFLRPRTNSKFHDLQTLGLLPKLDGIYRKDALCPEGLNNTCTPAPDYWKSSLVCYEAACENKSWRPDAVFISHAHADHTGYLPFLGNIPIYCSSESKILMKAISQIGNLDGFDSDLTTFEPRIIAQSGASSYFPGSYKVDKQDPVERSFNVLASGKSAPIGDKIAITSFDVGHSIPGSMCALVEAEGKQILYTGDMRFHGKKQPDLSRLYYLKPDVMITEGTRIDEHIPDNEDRVEHDLAELMQSAKGLVMVGFAWKDLERYETVRDAALSSGRTPVFDSRVAYLLARMGQDIYAQKSTVFVERTYSMLYSPSDYVNSKHSIGLIDEDQWSSKNPKKFDDIHLQKGIKATDIQKSPDKYVLHLDYFRFKNLLDINPPKGSVYIRAQCEPFDPRMEISEEKMINWLRHFGINEENDYEPYQIHASGHASGKELKEFIEKVKPKKLIPIHTTKPRLFCNCNTEVAVPSQNASIML